MTRSRRRRPDPVKGLVSGVAAGLAASWIMNAFQSAWSKASDAFHNDNAQSQETDKREMTEESSGDDATMKAADKLIRLATGHALTQDEKKKAGPLVHYAFGAAMGGVYGLVSEYFPGAHAGGGLVFGALLFAAADEIAVPALGLSEGPTKVPLSSHAYGLASHFVYGAGAEAVRKSIRAVA